MLRVSLIVLSIGSLVACDGGWLNRRGRSGPPVADAMDPFSSEAAFKAYLDALNDAQSSGEDSGDATYAADDAAAGSAPEAPQAPGAESDGITNNQVAGVDEGGIVKTYKDFLVVLRRGRLFTIRVSADGEPALAPTAMLDAFAPSGPYDSTWFDELLIYGDRIVVVGYSYAKSATEIALFKIADDGSLSHDSTHFLSSNDYYSSRNYASRLIDSTLVFYMPYYLNWWGEGEVDLPQLESGGADQVLLEATDIYQPVQATLYPTLHTVVRCDLAQPGLACSAEAVIGPYARTFYVSRDAVYLWVNQEWSYNDENWETELRPATVYRLPLLADRPQAIEAFGGPIDQFSFHEGDDGFLNVVVRSDGYGDAMWNPEFTSGALALARLPLDSFAGNPETIAATAYAILPAPAGYTLQNRFVGDALLYGAGQDWWGAGSSTSVYVKAYKDGSDAHVVELGHGVERIEPMGTAAAMVIGADGSELVFSALALDAEPAVDSAFVQANAVQGETRSHGFFYKATATGGMLGLPIRSDGSAWDSLTEDSASVLFLNVGADLALTTAGSLSATDTWTQDACVVSCADWYGNARPIFLGDRVLALLGYELVEGTQGENGVEELRRMNYYTDR